MKKLYVLYKILPGKRDQWLAWCQELETRKSEVLESLRQENCARETWVVFGEYVVAHVEFLPDGLQKSDDRPLNLEHRRQRKECLEKIEESSDGVFDFQLE